MNDTNENNPLGYEKLSVLLKRFAIPSIIAMVVSSLYNIVDQIFIGQGVDYDLSCDHTFDQYRKCLPLLSFTW